MRSRVVLPKDSICDDANSSFMEICLVGLITSVKFYFYYVRNNI